MMIRPGVALGARRLALVDVAGGHQPFATPDGGVWAVVNGEIFDDDEVRAELLRGGARMTSRCDAELWPHLHRRFGAELALHVRGQFAVAVWDEERRELTLVRDRHGICPLHYAEADGYLLFASEVRALFSSGLVPKAPAAASIDALFAHYAMPPCASAFEGVVAVAPGHLLRAGRGRATVVSRWVQSVDVAPRAVTPAAMASWADELEGLLARAVVRRTRGDVPVAAYLSGGVDSSTVATLAARSGVRDFFHVVPAGVGPDESLAAERTARELGGHLHVLRMGGAAIVDALPEAVDAAEHPVVDTSNACLLRLASAVKRAGFSVALSGEGADEHLGGYFWARVESVVAPLAARAPFDLRAALRRLTTLGLGRPVRSLPFDAAQSILYDPLATARTRFYRGALAEAARARSPIEAWGLDDLAHRSPNGVRRGLSLDAAIALPGHLLLGKGDRVAMRAAVELRYPFLDEDLVDFCAALPTPALVRFDEGKRLLRRVARRLGVRAARSPKTMFRADRSALLFDAARPSWVDELLSPESLAKVGWFDARVVARERARRPRWGLLTPRQAAMDACLTLVVTTQLWHHQHFGGGLCSLTTPP